MFPIFFSKFVGEKYLGVRGGRLEWIGVERLGKEVWVRWGVTFPAPHPAAPPRVGCWDGFQPFQPSTRARQGPALPCPSGKLITNCASCPCGALDARVVPARLVPLWGTRWLVALRATRLLGDSHRLLKAIYWNVTVLEWLLSNITNEQTHI